MRNLFVARQEVVRHDVAGLDMATQGKVYRGAKSFTLFWRQSREPNIAYPSMRPSCSAARRVLAFEESLVSALQSKNGLGPWILHGAKSLLARASVRCLAS